MQRSLSVLSQPRFKKCFKEKRFLLDSMIFLGENVNVVCTEPPFTLKRLRLLFRLHNSYLWHIYCHDFV